MSHPSTKRFGPIARWGATILLGMLALAMAAAGAFHARVQSLAHAEEMPSATSVSSSTPSNTEHSTSEAKGLEYFAYGSNMPTRYLRNVRGIQPIQSQAATLEDHALRFYGPGPNALEPGFAYAIPSKGEAVHGVVHRVRAEDLEKIRRSEGSAYRWATVGVTTVDGKTLEAKTLIRDRPGDPATPSARYIGLLLEGAREFHLPAHHVNLLESMRTTHVPVASEFMGSLLMARVMLRSGRCTTWLHCPSLSGDPTP